MSSADQFGDIVGKIRGRRSSGRAASAAVSTGSLTLDLHTGYRGLPRHGIVALGGDVGGAERLAKSTLEATISSGGVAVVIGRFDKPPSWAGHADIVLDWRGQDESLPELVGRLGNVADVVFVGTPSTPRVIDRVRSTSMWGDERARACVVAMPELVAKAGAYRQAIPDFLNQLRSRSDLVLQAYGFEAKPAPHLNVRVQKLYAPDTEVSIAYGGHGVEQATDLLAAARKIGVVKAESHEPIRYGTVEMGWEAKDAASFLRRRPDVVAALQDDVHSALQDDSYSAPDYGSGPGSPGAVEAETAGEAHDGPRRYVNTWFEADDPVLPLVVGRSVLFCLDIGPRSDATDAESELFEEPDFGGQSSLKILVTLYGDGVDVGTPNHSLTLPKVGRAGPIETEVVPRRADGCAIRILISLEHELTLLQDLTVRPPVVPAEEAVV